MNFDVNLHTIEGCQLLSSAVWVAGGISAKQPRGEFVQVLPPVHPGVSTLGLVIFEVNPVFRKPISQVLRSLADRAVVTSHAYPEELHHLIGLRRIAKERRVALFELFGEWPVDSGLRTHAKHTDVAELSETPEPARSVSAPPIDRPATAR